MQASEVDAVGITALGRHGIDRAIIDIELSSLGVANHRDELGVAPVVVHDPAIRIARMPLQHRPLLPVPCAAACQDLKMIALVESHHPDRDAVGCAWRAVVESRFVCQEHRPGGVPGTLVVIAEKVVVGTGGHRSEPVTRLAEMQPAVQTGSAIAARRLHPTLQAMPQPPRDHGTRRQGLVHRHGAIQGVVSRPSARPIRLR